MKVDIVVPQIGEAIAELRLVSWHKQVGDPVRVGDVLFEVDSDKAVVDVEAFSDGTLAEILCPDGSSVMPQQVVGRILTIAEPDHSTATPLQPNVAAAEPRVSISPIARRIAADLNIDIAQVKGTGTNGRITADDIRRHAQTGAAPSPAVPERVIASPKAKRLARERGLKLVGLAGSGPDGMITVRDLPAETGAPPPATAVDHDELIPLSRLRQTTALRTQASKQQVPHFYLMVDADMTQANALRVYCTGTLHWERPPTYTDLLIRAAALAIEAMPEVNRSYTDHGLLVRRSVGVGVAVATDAGLLVPVLAEANRRTLAQTSAELRGMAERARSGRLRQADMGEKSIVISNLGMFDVDAFIAIIDMPDPMILAVGRVAERFVPINGQPVVRPMCTLTLSVDHRALDGAVAARLLGRIKDNLEKPFALLGSHTP